MDEFGVFVVAAIAVVGGILFALGRYYPGSGAEQVDWRPTRSPELEAELELEDVDQMLEAQNARRRASGRPELTDRAAAFDRRHRFGYGSRGRAAVRVLTFRIPPSRVAAGHWCDDSAQEWPR